VAAASVEVCVWYEADPSQADAVRAAVARLAISMTEGAFAPPPPRLMRRTEPVVRDGAVRDTWMEVWPSIPADGLTAWRDRLAAASVESGAAALARGGRHVEPFELVPGPGTR